MALKDRIKDDLTRVFMQEEHFSERHTWNGDFTCPAVLWIQTASLLFRIRGSHPL